MIHGLLIAIPAIAGLAGITAAITLAVRYVQAVRTDKNEESQWRT